MASAFGFIGNGDVLLVEGRKLFARVIKWWTGSKYSHAALVVWVNFVPGSAAYTPCVLEAELGKPIGLTPLTDYLRTAAANGERVHWFALAGDHWNRAKVVQYASSQLGKRYASPRQFLISFGRVTRLLRRLRGKDVVDADEDRFFCSELVEDSLGHGGGLPFGLPAATEPGRLARRPDLEDRGVLML